jgi:hypothetical protein
MQDGHAIQTGYLGLAQQGACSFEEKRFVPQLATLRYVSSRCAITFLVSPLEPNSVFGYVDIVAGPTQVESFVYVRRAVLKRQASAQESK